MQSSSESRFPRACSETMDPPLSKARPSTDTIGIRYRPGGLLMRSIQMIAVEERRDRQGNGGRSAAPILPRPCSRSAACRRSGCGCARPSRPRHRGSRRGRRRHLLARKSTACVARACWRSIAATRPRREQPSQPPPTSPGARAPSCSSAARRLRCPNWRDRGFDQDLKRRLVRDS